MTISVRYGMNTVQLDRPEGTTVGALMIDSNAKSVLGYGDNVVPVVEGASVGKEFILGSQDEVIFQPRAATKGS
jgi:hypothetical protein